MLNEGKGRFLKAILSKHSETLATLRTELAHKDCVLRQLQQGQSDVLSLHSQLSDSHTLVATLIADGSAQLADLTEAPNTIEVLRADVVQREELHRFVHLWGSCLCFQALHCPSISTCMPALAGWTYGCR